MKNLRRIMAAILVITLLFVQLPAAVSAATVASGTCGENLTWTLDNAGTLTISGTGAMTAFSTTIEKPWNSCRAQIKTVIIEEGVTSIGRYAFYYCTNLTSIIIPDSIENVSGEAFGGCTSLTQEEGGITYVGNCVLDCDTSVTSVTLREDTVAIASGAFYNCTNLTSITIPKSVVCISDQAFQNCTALTTVTFENGSALKTIGRRAFSDLNNLASINVPDRVTNIGDSAFYYCSALTSFTIPSKLVNAGEDAFLNCKIKDIYVSDVEAYLNINVKNRDSLPRATEKLHILDYYGYEQTNLAIPQGVTNIREYAFYNVKSITSVSIPNSVTNIESYAFRNLDNQITFTYCGTRSQWDAVTREQYWATYRGWNLADAPIYSYHKYNSSGRCTACGSGAEGNCGENLTWKINPSTGTLTISGTGTMTDYTYSEQIPWNSYKSNIKHVVIESGVTSIGSYAFSSCDNLTSVIIGDSVTSIDNRAFEYCSNLTSVTIGSSVTTIGDYAFSSCDSLTSITIPDSVTSIGGGAFSSSGLTSVMIGKGITSIGDSAFAFCSSLKGVYITDIAAWCKISYSGSSSNPLYRAGKLYLNGDLVTDLVIPEGVTSVGGWTFGGCYSLTSVTIPDSVTHIGNSAFYSCSGLSEVTIPYSVVTIERGAFWECNSLSDVHYSGSVAQWEQISIGSNNDPLTSATIHTVEPTVTGITVKTQPNKTQYLVGESLDTTGLTLTATYSDGSTEDITEGFTVSGFDSTTTGTKTVTVTYEGFTATFTVSVVLGGTCGDNLTWTLDSAGTLTISGTGAMSNYNYYTRPWYSEQSGIKNVVIEDDVTSIGDYAFGYCSSLTSITIPDGVTSIGDLAFYCCTSLESVTIGNGVTSIGDRAFWGCSSLTGIWVDADNVNYSSDPYGVLFNKNKTELIQAPSGMSGSYTIPDGVTSIGDRAFWGCSSLTSITIPDSVTSIGDDAFQGCNGLTSITIPDSVTSIGDDAFGYCSSLTSITIPDSVTSIGDDAFGYCSSLTGIWVDADNVNYSSDPYGVLFNKNKTELIQAPGGMSGSYTIPDSVTSIGDYAFEGCNGLTSITIPDSATSIGDYAFQGCNGLTSITIPDSVTSIGEFAFSYCSSLESVTIGNGVTSIGDWAFYDCTSLESVTIGNGVTSIGSNAFGVCKSLTSITIPDSVTSIGDYAFGYCSSLESVTIGNGVTSIGACAFQGCNGLTSITIPDSVTSIGDYAFENCTSLTDVYYSGTAEQWAEIYIGQYNDDLTRAIIHYSAQKLTGITVKTQPNKTQYLVGESLDTTGLTLTATYSDGSTKEITEGFTVSGFDSTTTGTKTITVTYEGYTATFTVDVKAAEPEVTFGEKVYHNLRLQDLTKIGYAFTINTESAVDAYGVLIWTGNADDEVTVDTEGVQNKVLTYDSGFYTTESDGIYAQRLDMLHYAKPYVKIGDQYIYGSVDTYAPLAYAQTILDGTDEELKQLMVDMLNYGTYAQLYFAESNKEAAPEVLVNDILTEEQKVMNWSDDLKVATPTVTKDTAQTLETKWYGTNLNLLEAIQMNMAATGDIAGMYYWTEDAYNNAEVLNSESASGEAKIRIDGSYTIGGLTGIVAQSVSDMYYVCGYDANGNLGAIRADSVAAYATRLMESTASTEATVNMAKALLVYGNSAMNYFTQND